jgi:hypothetical protein
MPVVTYADKLRYAPQILASMDRIEAHRRVVRRLELIWGTLAIAFPLSLIVLAAYVIYFEWFW